MSARTYFVGNRIWWAGALFLAPIIAAIVGSPVAGLVAAGILVLPAFVLFDTDRSWWSGEVRTVPQDRERSRTELRLLTAFAGIGLALGVVIAYFLGQRRCDWPLGGGHRCRPHPRQAPTLRQGGNAMMMRR